MELQTAHNLATAALNLGVALAAGCCLSAAWLGGAGSPWAVHCRARLHGLALMALAAAAVADLAVLWLQAAAMAELPLLQAGPALYAALTATHYGSAWMAGMGALAFAAGATALRRRPALYAALVALAVFLYSRSLLSHAAADGDISWRVAFEWLHQVLAVVWVGEVFVAGLFTLRGPTRATPLQRGEQARYVEALSTSATVALAGIVVSGLYSTWQGLGSLDNVLGNPYSNVLLVKLVLVACAALLGGFNRLLVMPSLLGALRGSGALVEHSGRRFALVLQVEAAVLAAVLAAAAVLSSTSPPSAL